MKETRKPVREPRKAAVAKSAAKPTGKPAAKSVARPTAKPAAKSAAKPAPVKGRAVVRKKSIVVPPPATRPLPGDYRVEQVRVAAYFRAERRGFVPGCELEDWLAAEAEVSAAAVSPRVD